MLSRLGKFILCVLFFQDFFLLSNVSLIHDVAIFSHILKNIDESLPIIDIDQEDEILEEEPYGKEAFRIWYQRIQEALYNRSEASDNLDNCKVLTWSELEPVVKKFRKILAEHVLTTPWVKNPPDKHHELLTAQDPAEVPKNVFVQRIVLRGDASTAVFFRGDLHGDIKSLMECLNDLNTKGYLSGFKIRQNLPNKLDSFHMVFLGDYTDRGSYGTEVLYTIMKLKLANPKRVHLVRGNHETLGLVEHYGFKTEFEQKISSSKKHFYSVMRCYDLMPVALYLQHKNDVILCCHGGIDRTYRPTDLLNYSDQTRFLYQWFPAQDDYGYIGFLWNDFQVHPDALSEVKESGRNSLSQEETISLLKESSTKAKRIRCILRAHQHTYTGRVDMMDEILNIGHLYGHKGLAKIWRTDDDEHEDEDLWQNMVATFNVGPDSIFGHKCRFNYDTYAILKFAKKFTDWELQVYRIDVVPQKVGSGEMANEEPEERGVLSDLFFVRT